MKFMNKKIGTVLQYIFFLGGGIFLIWWQFHHMTPEQVTKFKIAISNADYRMFIPVIFMSLASHVSRSARWKILIAPMGYKPSLLNTFCVTMVGYLANSFVPRLGEILKCTLLGKYEKIPAQKLIGTIVVERVFDFLCYLIFILVTIIIQFKLVGDFVKDEMDKISFYNNGIAFWTNVIMSLAIIITAIFVIKILLNKYSSGKFVLRVKNFISGLKEGIASIKNLQNRGWFLCHTLFIWTMYLLQIYVGFSAIQEVSNLGLSAACSVLSLATLAMIITPGGIGTFPTAVFLVLGLYNIDQSTGEAFGWIMWGATTFIILFFGLVSLILLFFINRKPQQNLYNNSLATK